MFFKEIEEIEVLSSSWNSYAIKSISFLDFEIKIEGEVSSIEHLMANILGYPFARFLMNDTTFMIKEYLKFVYYSEDAFYQNDFKELLLLEFSKEELKKTTLEAIENLVIEKKETADKTVYSSPWTLNIFDFELRIYEKANSSEEVKRKILANRAIQELIKCE